MENKIPSIIENSGFEKFIIMNLVIGTTDLMPTIWKVYSDNTCTMDVFQSDIKTTIYRKVNEVADDILESDIKEIYCMITYTLCDVDSVIPEMTSKERMLCGTKDYLTFIRIDEELNEEEYFFEGDKLKDFNYLRNQLWNGKKGKLTLGRVNLAPIVEAFKMKKNL